jgi:hypothetical protein
VSVGNERVSTGRGAVWRSSFLRTSDIGHLTSDSTGAVFEAFVFEPEGVEVEFVALR